jgi:ornithine carbamoyltransferase
MKHFLELADWQRSELEHLLNLATHLKLEWQSGGNKPVLKNKILGMIFQKPSLRTRVSFEVGMKHLGGSAIVLGPDDIGLGKRESIADVARVLSGYVDGIMARVFAHDHVTGLAEWATVPVINGLSDDYHPCQIMADLLTIKEHYGTLDTIKIAYIGDGNNVAASLLYGAAHFGMDYAIATPEGYELPTAVLEKGASLAEHTSTTIEACTHPEQAVKDADVIYTDTWVSMGQEDEAAERREIFGAYQVNETLLRATGKPSIVMHCLPAHRGDEITDDVADGSQSVIFQQAENRLHAQKALLVHLLTD